MGSRRHGRGPVPEQAQAQAIRKATLARIAAGPVEAVPPPAGRVDWAEFIRSATVFTPSRRRVDVSGFLRSATEIN
jgi:hypothetical protein